MRRMVVAAALALLAPSAARADLVDPAPTFCPRGSEPSTGHGGPHCAPSRCTSRAQCEAEGRTCEPLGVCVERRAGVGRSGSFTFEAVVDTCDAQEDCPAGSRCEIAERCAGRSLTFWSVVAGSACVAVLALIAVVIVARRRSPAKPAR